MSNFILVSTVLPDSLEITVLGARSPQSYLQRSVEFCVKCNKKVTLNLHNSATGGKHISDFNSYFLHVLFFILSSAMCKWISICHR